MTDPQEHSEHRGLIESILRYVPGFRGYLEKGYRQESDYLARQWMADRLQRSKTSLDDYMVRLTDAGQIDRLPACEHAKTRLDGVILKMRGAVRGYSGFFDYVQVDVDLLQRVYEHDMSLIEAVDALAGSIEQLPVKPDAGEAGLADLMRRIDEVQRKFTVRADLLSGVAG